MSTHAHIPSAHFVVCAAHTDKFALGVCVTHTTTSATHIPSVCVTHTTTSYVLTKGGSFAKEPLVIGLFCGK